MFVSRSLHASALGAALALCACAPPAPAVDEERLARRVADLLAERYEEQGLCVARGVASGDESAQGAGEAQRADEDNAPPGEDRAAALRAQLANMTAGQRSAQREPEPAVTVPEVQLAAAQRAVSSGDEQHRRTCVPSLDELPAVGPADALVTVTVFLDPECPFCARLWPTLLSVQRAHPQDVRVRVALDPLPFHRSAPRASEAALEAFAQRQSEGFVALLSRLYEDPRDLSTDTIVARAEELGMDGPRFREALRDRRHARAVGVTLALAASANVTATPSFFVNGRKAAGALPPEQVNGLVIEELDRARRLARATPANRLAAALCRADASLTPSTPANPRPLVRTNGDTQ